jgi:hypothetical protein
MLFRLSIVARSSAVLSLSFERSFAQLSQAREFNVVRLC